MCVCRVLKQNDSLSHLYVRVSTVCIPHVIHRSIHHINIPSAKCIYHLSVCSCHGSSCWGSRELGHADASVLSIILISCVIAHLSIHSSTHLKAVINRFFNAKNTRALCSEVCFKTYDHMVHLFLGVFYPNTFMHRWLCCISASGCASFSFVERINKEFKLTFSAFALLPLHHDALRCCAGYQISSPFWRQPKRVCCTVGINSLVTFTVLFVLIYTEKLLHSLYGCLYLNIF